MTSILVVDDDIDILDALEMLLEDEGYVVTTSERGEYVESLVNGGSELPDLIILDVMLSGKDGRTICRQLKSEPTTRHVPIVMISAHPSAARSIRDVGADEFVAKPFDINVLFAAIERHAAA